MNIVLTGVIAGVLGTLAMDLLNQLFSKIGMISKIDVATIGRMAAGWLNGRFRYSHPNEMEQHTNEVLFGYITHYCIGISFAFPYVLGWSLLIGGQTSSIWALYYGLATTAASWFFVYPSMGFGAFGLRSPDGIKSTITSLANHLFFGVGMAVGVAL
jgi:uncharacterized membrane protein YeaQ/YmgE (transglycosylase-associated protein family)